MLHIINPEFISTSERVIPETLPIKRIAGKKATTYSGPADALARPNGQKVRPVLEIVETDTVPEGQEDKRIIRMEGRIVHPKKNPEQEVVRTSFYKVNPRSEKSVDTDVYLVAVPYSGLLDAVNMPEGLHLVDACIYSVPHGSITWMEKRWSRVAVLLIYAEPDAKPCQLDVSLVSSHKPGQRAMPGKDHAVYSTVGFPFDEEGLHPATTIVAEDIVMPEMKKDIFPRWSPEPFRPKPREDRRNGPRNPNGVNDNFAAKGRDRSKDDRRTKGTGRGPRQG